MTWREAFACRATAVMVLVASGAPTAQHGYTKAQVENGGRLYQASCATCHGASGDTVRGVGPFTGKYSRATSDEQLVRIIVTGIPGTAMSPNNYTDTDAGMIVAYLRAAGAAGGMATTGDVARGKAPALVDPSAEIHPDFRMVRAVTQAGATITGRLMNQDSFSMQLLDTTGQLRGCRGRTFKARPPMSHAVNGRQYVAISAGNALYAYALRQ